MMKREIKPLTILLVEDNPGDQVLLKKYLQKTPVPLAALLCAFRMSEAEAILRQHQVDLAFLDLTLPDSTGIQSFVKLNESIPHTPIVVLSGMSDEQAAIETIALGAQDYLMKGEFDEKLLTKAIQYSIERKKTQFHLEASNERYEIVNKATRDVICDWNFITRQIYVNNKLREIFGYDLDAIDIDWFMEKLHPEEREKVMLGFKNAIRNGYHNWEMEFRVQDAGDTYRFVLAKGYILFDAVGYAVRMIGSITDITEKKKLEHELVTQQVFHQKLITENTILAQEKEREELGKELHDNINQVLASVKMYLGLAKNEELMRMELLERSHENVTYAIEEIRKLSKSLVAPSLGDIGLREALEELAEEINFTKGLLVELEYEEHPEITLDAGMKLMLYRITQEQLNNINKYARANRILIKLVAGSTLFLSVADNGQGFDPAKKAKGIGLKNIASRVEFYNGTMQIISAPGDGCRLEVEIPLVND